MNEPVLRHSTNEVPTAAAVPAERIHDLNGPSQLNKRFACPGSARLEAVTPERETEAADRGTMLHAHIDRAAHGLPVDPLPDQGDVEPVRYVLEQYEADRIEGAERVTEYRVDLSAYGIPKGGSIDHAWILPGVRAVIHDPKFGDRPVRHPKHNWQMIAYALGIAGDFGVPEVKAVILRPNADHEWQRMEYTFDAAALDQLGRDLIEIVRATQAIDAPLTPGENCTFCRAKDVCPARWALVPSIPRHATFELMIRGWTEFERRSFYERAKIARQQLSGLIAKIEVMGLSGECPVTGYGATPGRETRQWAGMTTEVEATLLEICKLKGIEPAAIWSKPELVSPAQMEKLVGKSKPVAERMAKVIAVKQGEPSFGVLK